MSDTMRDAFEAWITKPLKNGRSLSDAMNDQQREIAKETWCDAWQAAQSQPAPPVPADVQEIMELIYPYMRACAEASAAEIMRSQHPRVIATFAPLQAALTALVDERDRLKFELDGVRAMRGPLNKARVRGHAVLEGIWQDDETAKWEISDAALQRFAQAIEKAHGIEPEQGGNHG